MLMQDLFQVLFLVKQKKKKIYNFQFKSKAYSNVKKKSDLNDLVHNLGPQLLVQAPHMCW